MPTETASSALRCRSYTLDVRAIKEDEGTEKRQTVILGQAYCPSWTGGVARSAGVVVECAPQTGEFFSQVEYRPFGGFQFRNVGFKFDGRNVADRRVKAFPVIDFFNEKRKPFNDVLVSFVVA